MPVNNPNNVTVLNSNVTGPARSAPSTPPLANGSYLIQMQATDSSGSSEYSLILVTVTGNYKPGRVTSTVTDSWSRRPVWPSTFNAPTTASTPERAAISATDGISASTSISPSKSQRQRHLHAGRPAQDVQSRAHHRQLPLPCILRSSRPTRAFGTLTDSVPAARSTSCSRTASASEAASTTRPATSTPIPTARIQHQRWRSAQSIADRSGNGLTITPNGITSTTGLNVPFVRDSQNRITQITDPQGNVYLYGYDETATWFGHLSADGQQSNLPRSKRAQHQPVHLRPESQYPDYPAHYYASGTDFRCNPLPTTTYYDRRDADGNSSLGKLASVTDAIGNTTSYAYNLSTTSTINGVEVPNTGVTTVTYPPDANGNIGTATMVYDSNGDLLSSTDPLGHTTTNTYDANHNLLSTTDPLGHTTSYTYDANGNKTSPTYPATATSTNTTSTTNYNQFSEPTSTTDEHGNTRTFNYDANYNPASVTDCVGTLMSTQFNATGQCLPAPSAYDITQNPARASQFTYDANGNLASKTDALGRTTSYTYNALGQKITMTEPVPTGSSAAAATTTYTYDAFGNLTQTQAPLGRTTSSTYDGNGNKISDTDARGNVNQLQVRRPQPAHRNRLPRRDATQAQNLRLPQQRGHRDRPERPRHAARLRSRRPPGLGHPGLWHGQRHHHQLRLRQRRAKDQRNRRPRSRYELHLRHRRQPALCHQGLRHGEGQAPQATPTTTRAIRSR